MVKEKPDNLKQLANYLHRDYQVVKKDSEILAVWGIIELKEEKPVALYEKITLEFPAYTKVAAVNEGKRNTFRV